MRLISVFLMFLLAISCGKQSSSSRVSDKNGLCNLNGNMVPCMTMSETADGLGIDLLDVQVDVPVQISGSQIMFMETKMDQASGRRISCDVGVKSGEAYQYSLSGDTLTLTTSGGSYNYNRNSGSGINGNWVWRGYVDRGTHIIKQISIVNGARAILKSHCEM